MTIVYRCDLCGAEFNAPMLMPIAVGVKVCDNNPIDWKELGDFCGDCKPKVFPIIASQIIELEKRLKKEAQKQ